MLSTHSLGRNVGCYNHTMDPLAVARASDRSEAHSAVAQETGAPTKILTAGPIESFMQYTPHGSGSFLDQQG